MVSVIVPVYNVEKYLPKCINSILGQTYTNLELLLVDDGSTDSSGRICDDYSKQDNRVRVFHKDNGGVSSARNVGLKNALGEYITFVDADDFLQATLYAEVIDKVEGKDLLFYNFSVLNENGQRICKVKQDNIAQIALNPWNFMAFYKLRGGEIIEDVLHDKSLAVYVWRALFSRKIITRYALCFDETLKSGEDRIFLFSYLLHATTIHYAENVFGYYHMIREGSLTAEKDNANYCEGVYEQCRNMSMAELRVAKQNEHLKSNDIVYIRMERAKKTRILVFQNEKRAHFANLLRNIKKWKKEEFFNEIISFESLFYTMRERNFKDVLYIIILRMSKRFSIIERVRNQD